MLKEITVLTDSLFAPKEGHFRSDA